MYNFQQNSRRMCHLRKETLIIPILRSQVHTLVVNYRPISLWMPASPSKLHYVSSTDPSFLKRTFPVWTILPCSVLSISLNHNNTESSLIRLPLLNSVITCGQLGLLPMAETDSYFHSPLSTLCQSYNTYIFLPLTRVFLFSFKRRISYSLWG